MADDLEIASEPYPRWVAVHESQVARKVAEDGSPIHVSVPNWPSFHVNRADGAVTVMVTNADEEARAQAEAPKADPVVSEPTDDGGEESHKAKSRKHK